MVVLFKFNLKKEILEKDVLTDDMFSEKNKFKEIDVRTYTREKVESYSGNIK
jgi:hypothetical protein